MPIRTGLPGRADHGSRSSRDRAANVRRIAAWPDLSPPGRCIIILLILLLIVPSGCRKHAKTYALPDARTMQAFDAVYNMDHDTLRQLLDGGLDVNTRNVLNMTLYDAALQREDLDAVAIVLDSGYDPTKTRYGFSLLSTAIFQDRPQLIRLLLDHGADPEYKDYPGTTAIKDAASMARPDIMRLFIDAGADLKADRGIGGETPLHAAAAYYDFKPALDPIGTVDLLLEQGLDVDARDDCGRTPLMELCDQARSPTALTLKLASHLVARGADVNARDEDGMTPLHCCADPDAAPLQRLLVELGADVNARDEDGRTPLYHLVNWYSDVVAMQMLLDLGADPNIADRWGWLPLYSALRRGERNEIQALLNSGARKDLAYFAGIGDSESVDNLIHGGILEADPALASIAISVALACDQAGEARKLVVQGAVPTPGDAVRLDDLALLKHVLAAGADPDTLTDERTALHYAAERGDCEAIRVLVSAGAEIDTRTEMQQTPLTAAISEEQDEAVELLLSLGADYEQKSAGGFSALSKACVEGRLRACRALIDAGADPNTSDALGRSPLDWATWASVNAAQITRLLLKAGADPNRRSDLGNTPLYSACSSPYLDKAGFAAVSVLLDAGADPDITDSLGLTTLWDVLEHDQLELAELLLERGADPDVPLSSGGTVLLSAILQNKQDRADLLRRYGAAEPPQWLIDDARRWFTYGGEPPVEPTEK